MKCAEAHRRLNREWTRMDANTREYTRISPFVASQLARHWTAESTEIQSRNATTGVMARTGTEMAEAHRDNAMHRKFVLQFHAARTLCCCCCASPSNVSDAPIQFGHHVCNIHQMAMHNPCLHLDGHDRTCQNPGDRHSVTR